MERRIPDPKEGFQVAADHVGKFTENIEHVIVHLFRWIGGKKAAGEAASLAPVALEQNRSVPIARQVYGGYKPVRARDPGHRRPRHLQAHHGPEYARHDLRHFFRYYLYAQPGPAW